MQRVLWGLSAVSLALFLGACEELVPVEQGIPTDAQSIEDGRKIATTHCAICHGLGQDESLRADAAPLRYILSGYPAEKLQENFEAGVKVGHEDMPDFVFGPLGSDVLLAYIVSIKEPVPVTDPVQTE